VVITGTPKLSHGPKNVVAKKYDLGVARKLPRQKGRGENTEGCYERGERNGKKVGAGMRSADSSGKKGEHVVSETTGKK